MKKFFIFIFTILFISVSFSENFKVGKLHTVEFSDIAEVVTFQSKVNDSIFIKLPTDMTYVCGFEINLKIPEEIAAWRDSVSYSLYEDIKPNPLKNKNETSFSGKRISYATIPGRLSQNIYIPLTEEFNIKDNPYSEKIPITQKNAKNDIFFRFQLVMKDVPDGFANQILETSVKTVLINKGMLNLSIDYSKQQNLPVLKSAKTKANTKQNQKANEKNNKSEKEFLVFIDDKPISEYNNLMLQTGEHHTSITSDKYRNELRTFIIDQAKTTNLSIELRGIEPTVYFICPINTEVYFDEQKIENTKTSYIIEPGEHSAKMIVGDYEIVKNFIAVNGRSYSISLEFDANIHEEQ